MESRKSNSQGQHSSRPVTGVEKRIPPEPHEPLSLTQATTMAFLHPCFNQGELIDPYFALMTDGPFAHLNRVDWASDITNDKM